MWDSSRHKLGGLVNFFFATETSPFVRSRLRFLTGRQVARNRDASAESHRKLLVNRFLLWDILNWTFFTLQQNPNVLNEWWPGYQNCKIIIFLTDCYWTARGQFSCCWHSMLFRTRLDFCQTSKHFGDFLIALVLLFYIFPIIIGGIRVYLSISIA